jgi:hypothetical protein
LYNILIEFGVPMKLVRLIKMFLNETYSKMCICNHLLVFNFALVYPIWKVPGNQAVMKLNWTHQLLAYADDVNLWEIK